MKIDKGGMKRISKKRGVGNRRSEKEPRHSYRCKFGGWSGRDKAQFSGREHLLAKTFTSLKKIPAIRTELVDGFKKEINGGTYMVPVEALANILITKL